MVSLSHLYCHAEKKSISNLEVDGPQQAGSTSFHPAPGLQLSRCLMSVLTEALGSCTVRECAGVQVFPVKWTVSTQVHVCNGLQSFWFPGGLVTIICMTSFENKEAGTTGSTLSRLMVAPVYLGLLSGWVFFQVLRSKGVQKQLLAVMQPSLVFP